MYKFDITYDQIIDFAEDLKYRTKLDIKMYSLGAIKRIVGGYMDRNSIDGFEELTRWININPGNKNDFMRCLIPDKTEFFRDPGLWRHLASELPKVVNEKGELKILDLGTSTGDELYSLMMVIEDLGIKDKITVCGTEKYKIKIDQLKEGRFSDKKLEASVLNYQRYKPGGEFKEFVDSEGKNFQIKQGLLDGVDLKIFDLSSERAFAQFDIVLCRNVMCYYSTKKSRPIYKTLSDFLKVGGMLILGAQEDLSNSFYNRDFECINEEFKIYKKIK